MQYVWSNFCSWSKNWFKIEIEQKKPQKNTVVENKTREQHRDANAL